MSDAQAFAPLVGRLLSELHLQNGGGEPMPRVLVNMVSSVDGRATLQGRSGGLSSQADRRLFLGVREGVDAVLVGAGTARTERYGRMLRDEAARQRRRAAGLEPEPLACIVTDDPARVAQLPLLAVAGARVAILTAGTGDLGETAAEVRYVRCVRDGRLDLRAALEQVGRECAVRTVACEGGPTLNGTLFAQGLADEVLLTVAPALVGGRDPLTIIATEADLGPVWLALASANPIGSHVFLRYRVRASEPDGPAPEG